MRVIASVFWGAAVLCAASVSTAETDSGSAPEAPPAGDLEPFTRPPASLPAAEIHGGLTLWHYQPLSVVEDPKPGSVPLPPEGRSSDVFIAGVEVSGRLDGFGVFLALGVRDKKPRAFFASNVWMQEAYAFYETPDVKAKVGKIASRLSPLSDGTFSGNLPYLDGIKADIDYGFSLEGAADGQGGFAVGYDVQYFPMDAHTNGSLSQRDTVWLSNVTRRNIAVLRISPSYRFTPAISLRAGLAGQVFGIDRGKGVESSVLRLDVDASFAAGPVRVFGECIAQVGRTAENYPFAPVKGGAPGRASAHNLYVVAGAELKVFRFLPRYSVSLVEYRDLGVVELLHVAGVTAKIHDNVDAMLEYVYFPRREVGRSLLLDQSLNVVIRASF